MKLYFLIILLFSALNAEDNIKAEVTGKKITTVDSSKDKLVDSSEKKKSDKVSSESVTKDSKNPDSKSPDSTNQDSKNVETGLSKELTVQDSASQDSASQDSKSVDAVSEESSSEETKSPDLMSQDSKNVETELSKELTSQDSKSLDSKGLDSNSIEAEISEEPVATEQMTPESKSPDSESEELESLDPVTQESAIQDVDSGPETTFLTEEEVGIRGNWVKKREWLVHAKEKNNEIQSILNDIEKYPVTFWERYKKIQDDLDVFYREIGDRTANINSLKEEYEAFSKKINTVKHKDSVSFISNIVNFFSSLFSKDSSVKDIPTSFDQDEYDMKMRQVANDLDSLDRGIRSIKDLDSAINKRMDKINEQTKIARDAADEARKKYNAIWDIIDDEKAKDNFYDLKNIKKKVQSISDYLNGDFERDFNNIVSSTDKEIDKVRNNIKILEEALVVPGEAVPVKTVPGEAVPVKTVPVKTVPGEAKDKDASLVGKARLFAGVVWSSVEGFVGDVIGYVSDTFDSISNWFEDKFSKGDQVPVVPAEGSEGEKNN